MDDAGVFRAVADAAASNRPVALVTVLATRGSTPRHVGSKMVVDPVVGLVGTIGGGCGEADVIAAAEEALRTGTPRVVHVALTDPVDSWSPAVCGGTMQVLVEPILAPAAGSPHGPDRAETP